MERNIFITIEYDGSGFCGWQRQPNVRTVQGHLEEVLSHVCGTPIKINGTSRTDAGVHALGQCASFRGEFGIPTERIMLAANNILAGGRQALKGIGDVRITALCEMPQDFHARFSARGKQYRYLIRNLPEPDIFRRRYCYQVLQPLDIEAMRKAAAYIVGTHDFKCFQAAGGEEKETTVRTIYHLDIDRRGDDVVIEISGDGFGTDHHRYADRGWSGSAQTARACRHPCEQRSAAGGAYRTGGRSVSGRGLLRRTKADRGRALTAVKVDSSNAGNEKYSRGISNGKDKKTFLGRIFYGNGRADGKALDLHAQECRCSHREG